MALSDKIDKVVDDVLARALDWWNGPECPHRNNPNYDRAEYRKFHPRGFEPRKFEPRKFEPR